MGFALAFSFLMFVGALCAIYINAKTAAILSVFVSSLITGICLSYTASQFKVSIGTYNTGLIQGESYYIAAVTAAIAFVTLVVNGFSFNRESVQSGKGLNLSISFGDKKSQV